MDHAHLEKQFKMFMKDIMVDQNMTEDQFAKMKVKFVKH